METKSRTTRGSTYSISHLCNAIWGNHNRDECVVTVYETYYDASGAQSDRDGVLLVLGVYATESRWLRFENQWDEVLDDFEVPFL